MENNTRAELFATNIGYEMLLRIPDEGVVGDALFFTINMN